ncbi:MAG: FliG C-terminal domain-containing protein [Pseudomonadota bacterium]
MSTDNLPIPAPQPDQIQPWDAARAAAAQEGGSLKPIEKAAIILSAVGPEVAANFLKAMDERNLTRCAMAIASLDKVSEELLDATIAEFLLSIGTEEEVSGGNQTARRLLGSVLDEASIERIMFDVEGGDVRGAWKKLNDCPTAALSNFIALEHPQTATVILAELRADKAAAILDRLDKEFANTILLRLASVPVLDPLVSDAVEEVIGRDFLSAIKGRQRTRKPAELIASMMNNLPSDSREAFLQSLEESKPNLAKEVLRVMFTFADIRHRVQARDIALVVKAVDEPVLVTALAYGLAQRNPSSEFIIGNIPKRLAERLTEDIEAVEEVTPRDGEPAMQEVVRQIQDLAKAGQLEMIEDEAPEED